MGWYGTGRKTLKEVWKGSGDPQRGPGRVAGPLGKIWTGRGTLGEVRKG